MNEIEHLLEEAKSKLIIGDRSSSSSSFSQANAYVFESLGNSVICLVELLKNQNKILSKIEKHLAPQNIFDFTFISESTNESSNK